MNDVPETNHNKTPRERLADAAVELLEAIKTLACAGTDLQTIPESDVGHFTKNHREGNAMNDTPETDHGKEPIDRLMDVAGELIDIHRKLADSETPGHWQEFTDGEAELAGAFDEDAISEDDAYGASFDNPDA